MRTLTMIVVATAVCVSAVSAEAQGRQGNQRGARQGNMPAPAPGMPLPQLQAMFDAYVLVQAQGALQLDDAGYQQFFPRMNRLQDVRRQHTQQRARLIAELRRQAAPTGADDQAVLTPLQRLNDLDAQFQKDLQAALAG